MKNSEIRKKKEEWHPLYLERGYSFWKKKRKNYLFSIVGVAMHRQALISLVSTPPGPLDSFPLTPRLPGCPAGGGAIRGPRGEKARQL